MNQLKMKSTGIVRKVDNLGRIVIPKELRKVLTIKKGQPIEIFTSDDLVILRKFETSLLHEKRLQVINDLKKFNESTEGKSRETITEVIEDAIELIERDVN